MAIPTRPALANWPMKRFTSWLVCLIAFVLLAVDVSAAEPAAPLSKSTVEFVVGDLLVEEGGQWDPKSSPLQFPFGIDFDRDGNMFVVELEGDASINDQPRARFRRSEATERKVFEATAGR